MIEKDLFDDQYEKLLGICDKNNLVADFSAAQYPIMLTVRPDASMEGQISMLEDDVGHNNRDSRIRFVFVDGRLVVKVSDNFTLTDTLLNKLKNIAKKLYVRHLAAFFREAKERSKFVETNAEIQTPDVPGTSDETEIIDALFSADDEVDTDGASIEES